MNLNRRPSYWEKDALLKPAQFGVIGSGLVGLGAALEWKRLRPRDRVVVFERAAIPAGASTRNAGFACFGSPSELLDDLQTQPESEVWDLVAKRWEGLRYLRQLIGDAHMEYEGLGGYEIFRNGEEALFEACRDKLESFNARIESITGEKNAFEVRDDLIAPFGLHGVRHIILNRLEGQLHPGKMIGRMQQLAQAADIQIMSGMELLSLAEESETVQLLGTDGYAISCEKVLVATNGFARQLIGDLSLVAARNQVLITYPIPNLALRGAFHYDRGYYYFRNVGDRILFGGGRNLFPTQEETSNFGLTDNIIMPLKELLSELILPGREWKIDQYWSGILGLGPQKNPIFRFHGERIFLAVRLGGMGVALGAKLGAKAARQLLESAT
ncbi:MAG: FAD-binding oxidoreductase [Saprospiraceae bacterium]|nr:FAD-binding oxidoreductase [Saprospiraceae bacterium]